MFILEILNQAISITSFVLILMLLLEFFTIKSHGKWNTNIQKSSWLQILFGAVLGVFPGCAGGFVAVSLYSHKIIGFAALMAVMITATGDDAFVMLTKNPEIALQIFLCLFITAIITGLIINIAFKNKNFMKMNDNHLKIHSHEIEDINFGFKNIFNQLRNITFHRALLLGGGLFFIIFLMNEILIHKEFEIDQIIYIIGGTIAVYIISIVPDHFLKEHLWEHVIKKHFIKIFLWTVGAIALIHYINSFLEIKNWIHDNHFYSLLLALLIGIIPQSGPHLVFFLLYFNDGNAAIIPFSVLLANSVVQDGHGTIPLLAESRKSFFVLKGIKILIGFIIGMLGYIFHF